MPAHTPPAPLRRRWFLALIVSLLVAVSVTAGVWFFLPPKEIAYAKLVVSNQMGGAVFQHPEANTDAQTYLRTQVAYLRSPWIIERALNDPEVAKLGYPDGWILQQLKIDFPDGPQILRLSLELENPEEARLVIAAIINAYFEVVVDQDKKARAKRLERLEELSKDAEARLAAIKRNQRSLNLDEDQDDLNHVAKFAELIASKRDELKVEMDAPARVKLLEPARIERIDPTPRKIRFAGLAGLGGLVLTLLVFAFAGFRHRRLDSPETTSSSSDPAEASAS